MDTLISNVTIVTMNEKMDVLFGAHIGIQDGKISFISFSTAALKSTLLFFIVLYSFHFGFEDGYHTIHTCKLDHFHNGRAWIKESQRSAILFNERKAPHNEAESRAIHKIDG